MRFWQLASYFRAEEHLLREVLSNPLWGRYANWFENMTWLVNNQDRAILDSELPTDLCRAALSLTKRRYRIRAGHLFEALNPEETGNEHCLTALEIYDHYGGECLEEAAEKGSYLLFRPGMWGLFPLATRIEAVHPDDRGHVPKPGAWSGRQEIPSVFELQAFDGEYAVLNHGLLTFRGNNHHFKRLEGVPSFLPGEQVLARPTGERAQVRRIDWHFKRETFIYLLLKGTRKSNAWHFSEDLARIDETGSAP